MTSDRLQTRLLARTFFARLFETDLMPPGVAQERVAVAIIAFFAAPSLVLPLLLMKKYVWPRPPEVVRMMMAQDRTMALLLAMTATAFISLVIWENIFPDRRDSRILGVLPVRNRSFVSARLLAVGALFAVLFLLPTAMSSIAFGILGSMTRLPEGFLGVTAAHFLAVAAAQGFIFFGVLTIQCALLSVAGPAAAHRLAVVLQIAMIVAVLQMPLVLPPGRAFGLDDAGVPLWAGTMSAPLLPPLWFLSFYQSLIGSGYAGATHLALAAALLGLGTPALALGFYAASYARLTRLAIEGRPAPRRARGRWARGGTRLVSRFATATAEGAAVCAFTLRTAARSRQHRMLLAVWIGVALALTISAALPVLVRLGWSALEQPRGSLLVGPLILAALVQTGMRSLFAIPVEIRANWVIRLCEPLRLRQTLSGAAAALIICGVIPPAVLALVSAAWLWDLEVGIMHSAFCGVLSLVLVQVLMFGVDKVPFTCTYSPGSAKIDKLWFLYLTVFSIFTYGMADGEAQLLRSPRALLITIGVLAATAGALWWMRLRRTRELPGLCFEAQPDDVLTLVSL